MARKAFRDLELVRREEQSSIDLIDATTEAINKARRQFRIDKHFRRAQTSEFIYVLEEIMMDLDLIRLRVIQEDSRQKHPVI